MNPLELRYQIYKFLTAVRGPVGVGLVILADPEPGKPVALDVITDDPFGPPRSSRRYRVTIEETDATA